MDCGERSLKPGPTGEHIFAAIRVAGRVQGVGYRYYAYQIARRLELNGWVANASDGAVILEVEGLRGAVSELLTELRRGPVTARVAELRVEEGIYQGRFASFRIEPDRFG